MKRISILAPMWKKLTSKRFWFSIPRNMWRATCRTVLSILEFRFKVWLYEQVYPQDRYNALDDGERYDRL